LLNVLLQTANKLGLSNNNKKLYPRALGLTQWYIINYFYIKRQALERWETKLANTKLTPQTIWPIVKSSYNRDGPRAPTAIHGLLGLKYHPVDKVNTIDDCLKKLVHTDDLSEENHEQRVEARVQALLEAVDSDPLERIRPCDSQKLLNSLKLTKACGTDGIPNECLRHLPRRPLVHLTHLINHCIRLSHFPSWKEAKAVALPKPGKDPKFLQNLHPISLLPSTGKVFEKVILEIVKIHIGERNLLNGSQFGFCERHSTTLQYMRLADHMTLHFNNNMSTATVFLDIEKAFDTTWHPGLLYKISELQFSTSFIKLSSFLSKQKFRVSAEGEMSTPRYMQAGVPQGSVLSLTLYTLYFNDSPPPPTFGVNLALFADDTCLYATDHKEGYVLRKIQHELNSIVAWCECWNIKINEDKTWVIYFTHKNRPPDSPLMLNGWNTPFVNSVKYLGVIFDKRMTWRYYI
jgi:hypothetical protein